MILLNLIGLSLVGSNKTMTRKTRSQSSGQILDDHLANQINDALESSDSDDDSYVALGEQVLNLATTGQDIMPKLTESQVISRF